MGWVSTFVEVRLGLLLMAVTIKVGSGLGLGLVRGWRVVVSSWFVIGWVSIWGVWSGSCRFYIGSGAIVFTAIMGHFDLS